MKICRFVAFAFGITTALSPEWEIGQEVSTTNGLQIKGHASSWQPEVSQYLGVPFAQPPVGSLRFAAPKTYRGYGRITADHYVSEI